MAGPVKGTIGQEEVVLEDAATEQTLAKLLAVVEKGSGGNLGGAKDAKQNLMKMAKQTGKTTKELEDFEEQVEEAGNSLTRGFGHIKKSVENLALEFMAGSERISDFSQHIAGALSNIPLIGGLLGGTLQLLTSTLDNSIDTFRELSQVGVDFGADLMNARKAAAEAGLRLDTFNEVIQNNSTNLALLAGSATTGAMRFTQISKQVQESQMQFSRLGITMEETAAFTAEYMDQQRRLGRGQRMTDAQLAAGTKEYIGQLDFLARVTGKQREQIAEELKANREDERLKLLFANLDEGTSQTIDQVLTMMGSAAPELQEMVKELIASQGTPLSEYSKNFVSMLGPQVAEASRLLAQGKMTPAEFMKIFQDAKTNAEGISKAQGEVLSTMAAMGDTRAKVIGDMISAGEVGTEMSRIKAEQEAAAEENAKSVANFEKSIVDAKNAIMVTLIESGVFKTLQDAMSSFALFLDNGGTEKIKQAIEPFTAWFNGLLTDLQTAEDPMKVIMGYLKDGMSNLGELIKPLIQSAFSGLGSTIMSAIFGGGSSEETPAAGGEGGEATAGASMFVGLDSALEKLAGMVAVGGVVYGAIKGFQLLLGGFASPAVATGVAVLTGLLIGTSGAIALAGQGISSAGDGIEKIASGLERMGAITGAQNIKDLSSALGDMGTAMLSLGAGNVLDSILGLFGASSPFDKMVDGINTFSKVNQGALQNMATSSGALDTLKTFADDIDSTNIKEFAGAIKELANSMQDLNNAYNSSTGIFGRNAPGTQEILNAISSGAQQGGQGLNTSIGELITLMRENNVISRKILTATGDGV